jgi:hypothetical protein
MALSKDIILRPRFKFDINVSNEKLLTEFESNIIKTSKFKVNRIDNHIFIKLPRDEQHFWTPQLDLEINKKDSDSSTIHGLFGPNPKVWTLFMFFHFIIAGFFIAFGVWAYTNWKLGQSYALQLFMILLTVVLWFTLYLFGSLGRAKGKPEMHQLNDFMKDTLKNYF